MDKKTEHEMEALDRFKGVCRDITPIIWRNKWKRTWKMKWTQGLLSVTLGLFIGRMEKKVDTIL